ncbi:cysteine proteinase [Microthyrium microscopicum]|uniref:Cysteine proteinase n=1 Tax=Microthyrium microscopicum TaxID=703497 RepID=A0A6A6U2Q3_9PEZI|nr:cysteine proteinase [Microthyrium microscopicum]
MPKRPAVDNLEEVAAAPSPAAKRPRVDNGNTAPSTSTGTPDILGADMEEHEELVEAGVADLLDGDDGLEDEDEDEPIQLPRQTAPVEGYQDLYLDTINRALLDFDFEKLCSVTLSNINVYACLVCGKYYQGRGPKSQAYFHALDEDHHVYINLESQKVYVLPENYEVTSKSLDDIKFVANPKMPKEDVMKLDKTLNPSWDLAGNKYIPGFVGINNIKANDYLNSVIQLLSHVAPLRNFFMLEDLSSRPQLAQRFGILIRKIWNPHAFKAHVSPHELLQEITLRSNKKFTLSQQSDPVDFLNWFLNNLHIALGGSKSKPGTSMVQRVFQGSVQIESQAITARADAGDRLRFEDAHVQTDISRFLLLTLDLPAAPLFQDELDKNIIPQVPLTTILSKYDGIHAQEKLNFRRRYRLLHPLPPYLLFHVKRFSANKFVSERNPTIVTFQPTGLDMSQYVVPNPALHPVGEPIIYDLVANITHEAVRVRDDSVEGEAEKKVWRCQVMDRAGAEWFEIQDLFVEKAAAETLFTKESYVQVWERRKAKRKGKAT